MNEAPETPTAVHGAAGREWLFKSEGQVFGPVPEAQLLELLYQGRVGAATEVAGDDGRWCPLARIPGFLVHVKKAEAHQRVSAEVTGARKLAQRRSTLRSTAALAGIAALVLLAASGAWLLATKRPWERRSALLADFGEGIVLGSVQVGAGRADRQDEVAVPEVPEPGAATARPKRAGPARARANGVAEGGDLVLAQYDPRRIQDVVARQQSSLAPCLRAEAQRSPDFSGNIPIEFAVGNDGRVTQLWIDEPIFKSGPLRDCILDKLRAWAFDPFPGERPIVSLAFKIGR
jgi:hypothetical protein